MTSIRTLPIISKTLTILNSPPVKIFMYQMNSTVDSLSERNTRTHIQRLCRYKDAQCTMVGIKGTWK